jgi:hypothetical protein
VTALRRRLANPLVLVALAALVGACGPTTTGPSARPSTASTPALTAVPGGPASPVVGATAGPPTTTETEFGTIYDALPASFPKLPGQEPAETGDGPTSGSFALRMDSTAASKALRTALVAAGWTADVGSPLEDGTVILEAARQKGCKAEVRFTPRSGTVLMSVLYGAACPFS